MLKKIYFVLCLLVGLMMINSGLNKIFNYLPMPTDLPESMMQLMASFAGIRFLMPMIAVAEIIGGLLFIIPKYRALGAIIIFPVLLGILFTHVFYAPAGLPIAIIFLAVETWVLLENRQKYLQLIR